MTTYKLVPTEPTEEMLDAGFNIDARGIAEAENKKRFPTFENPWASAGQVLAIQYRAMLAAAPWHTPINDIPLIEAWHGERKITVYENTVIRVWGSHINDAMSEEPRSIQSVQSALDWLYAPVAAVPDGVWEALPIEPTSANLQRWKAHPVFILGYDAMEPVWQAVVPVEPTPAMLCAMWQHRDAMRGQSENKIARVSYAAMLAASKAERPSVDQGGGHAGKDADGIGTDQSGGKQS